MTEQEFNTQVQRLVNNFGKQAYSPERALLLWREVNDFSGRWFSNTVDKFIGELKHAPLLPEFREEISKERERLWNQEKDNHKKEVSDFWEGTFHTDEVKSICEKIRRRLKMEASEEEYSQFVKMLNYAVNHKPKERRGR